MRIVFNALAAYRPKTGVGHYAARLLAALGPQLPPDSLRAFPDGRLAALLTRMQRTAATPAGRRKWPRPLAKLKAWGMESAKRTARAALAEMFRSTCRRTAYDLYHEPNFIPFLTNVPTVVTVHDLSVLMHPEWHPADRVRMYDDFSATGLARARHVITDSEFIRRQVIRDLGVAPGRVTAVPLGVGPEYGSATPDEIAAVRRLYGLPERYLLYVGTIEPRKNLAMLLRAYCDLPPAMCARCPLVLAGGWGWKSDDVAELFRAEAAAKGVVHLGYTPDDVLPALYAGARALVLPSLYEGFGLPPAEMLACGGAVIASTADVLGEVMGKCGIRIDARDLSGWCDVMRRVILDDDWHAELRRGAREQARLFTWERCAAATAVVYRSVAEPGRRAA